MWKTDIRSQNQPELQPPDLGATLKSLRQDKGWTLGKLGAQSGVSPGTLSRIENGQLSPTYDTITKICDGLGLSLGSVLQFRKTQKLAGWRSLTQMGQGRMINTPQYRLELLNDDAPAKPFIVFRAEILARELSEFDHLHSHPGQEQIIVERGQVEIITEFYPPALLTPGDSFAFDSAMGHALLSKGPETSMVLWVCDQQ